MLITSNTARAVTVADFGWSIIMPHQAADLISNTSSTSNTARAVTVADGGWSIIIPYQAADIKSTSNTARVVTVADAGWNIIKPHQTADSRITCNIYIRHAKVANRGAICVAEQADKICIGAVDVEIINGMFISVIVAGKICRWIPNGWKAAGSRTISRSITVPVHISFGSIKSDVGGLDEIFTPITASSG